MASRILLGLAAAALLAPATLLTQSRGITLEEMAGLLRSNVSSARVLTLAQERCVAFHPTGEALATLRQAGATAELLEGLRTPNLCTTTGPTPVPPPPAADTAGGALPPLPRNLHVDRAPFGPPPPPPGHPSRGFFASLTATAAGFNEKGTDLDVGGGMGVEVGYAPVPALAFFVRVDGGWRTPPEDEGGEQTLWFGDVGGRVYLGGRRAAVRPFADASFTAFGIAGDEEELSGTGFSAGGGVQARVARNLAVDLGFRWLAGTLDTDDTGGESTPLEDEIEGRGARVYLGISGFPGGR
jgi:Outer membrane protein beta-barrel domain